MVKILAINGSPKKEKGNTALFLAPFLEGMKDAGALPKLIYSQEMEIKPCVGDFSCWYKDPGKCFIQDDMQALYTDLFQTEILILATPLYIPLPGKFQEFINRLCPLLEPILEFKEGRTRARFHSHVKIRKIALVATSGWWEMGNFQTLVPIFQNLAEDASVEFAGALLRPHASFMRKTNPKVEEIRRDLFILGREFASKETLSPFLLEKISQPLISEEEFRNIQNQEYMKIRKA